MKGIMDNGTQYNRTNIKATMEHGPCKHSTFGTQYILNY